jgi:aminopeptidase
MDKRWCQLGDLLVRHSTRVQPGERVMIAMHEVETYPLALAVYESAIQAGAYPQVQFLSESLRHVVLKHGSDDQVRWVPEIEAYGMEWADVYLGLRGGFNLYEHADIPDEVLAANQAAMGKVSTLRWQKTRWCVVRVPNALFAQQAETTLDAMMEMFFDACLIDWEQAAQRWQAQARILEQGGEMQIVGRDTDLRFSVAGRKWVAMDGRINMPDGEIFTAPVTDTLDGYITFEWPGVLSGRLMHGLRLEWSQGRLMGATASTNQAFLDGILAADAGAKLIGEFAFGTNPHINRFCKDILLDEKIGGTIHIALGRAYPECGGTNQSSIHWDIVKDMRAEGRVLLDGRVIFEGGRLLI